MPKMTNAERDAWDLGFNAGIEAAIEVMDNEPDREKCLKDLKRSLKDLKENPHQ